MRASFAFALLASLALAAAAPIPATAAKQLTPPPLRVDLADKAVGAYAGAVTADSRGAPQAGVTLTVTKVAFNTVKVVSSYARLPAFQVTLIQAGTTISQSGGANVFRLDESKTPFHLDVTTSGATWSGDKG